MKTLFAVIGLAVSVMALMGALGIADFRLYFGRKGSYQCDHPESP